MVGRLARRAVRATGGTVLVLVTACWLCSGLAAAAGRLEELPDSAIDRLVSLAAACQESYDDDRDGVCISASGAVALVREDAAGNLIIAFRGSVIGDRNADALYKHLGGAAVRQTYRDWAATNLKQVIGFMPRQYIEAADLVAFHLEQGPPGRKVYVTGHSKGGGMAEFAVVAAYIAGLPEEATNRLYCITYNAAVVRNRTWERLMRQKRVQRRMDDLRRTISANGSILALVIHGDTVSGIAANEAAQFGAKMEILPSDASHGRDLHSIDTVIRELHSIQMSRHSPPRAFR